MLLRKKNDQNGAIWCILNVPKLVIKLKINIFLDNKSTTQILRHIFSKFNPDAHFGTKINTFTYHKADLGAKAHKSQKM